jgi:hypothetical protein
VEHAMLIDDLLRHNGKLHAAQIQQSVNKANGYRHRCPQQDIADKYAVKSGYNQAAQTNDGEHEIVCNKLAI